MRLTTFGYLGHMWELYALWTWLPAFYVASRHDPARLETGAVAFAAIGVAGLSGSVLAGHFADRIGRSTTTSAAMLLSGPCRLAGIRLVPVVAGALGWRFALLPWPPGRWRAQPR